MSRFRALAVICILATGVLLLSLGSASASKPQQAAATVAYQYTPTSDITRLAQPPTVYPPVQADNGAQIYWGMCMDCHGDQGQGLTDEWRNSFPASDRDCWQSGCHAGDAPENSFEIPTTGAPALAGAGKLTRFSNTYELSNYIRQNMPFFRAGSLTSEAAWSLAAYLLRLNDRRTDGFTLNKNNGSAIPVHHSIKLPESGFPFGLVMIGVLLLTVIGWNMRGSQIPARTNFFHHLHPPSIPRDQSRFSYTLAAGGLAVFLSLVLLFTGLLEMYYYVPTPEQAAISVETITTLVPFGNLVRNLHFWSAQFLVIVVTFHLLRVTLTGAYAPPRRFNNLLGLGLLVLILLLDFTGYVLRWDEGIHWALVVGVNMLRTVPWIGEGMYRFVIGGSEVGAATLIRFYAWHIFGLALIAAILTIWHVFRVRRDGGIAVPPPSERKEASRITRFELLHREVLAMAIAAVVLLLISLIVPAPIEQPISDAGTMTGSSHAPWFFLWVQQLLKFGNPFLLGVLTPVLVVVALAVMPYVLPNARPEELGRWFPRGNRIAQVLTVLIILLILVLTVWGAISG
jgi:quinol-cytochrome oxidoreductase complex cytochrome b subunit/mono/diheme cytochrome c family protein